MRRTAALLCALALSLSACAQAPEDPEETSTPVGMDMFSQPQEPEPVQLPERFALPYESERTLDPITCPDGMQQVVGSLIYEGLFRLDQKLEPVPCLCGSYAYDAPSKTWTFVLRDGVTFSDGTPLTAREVKTALDRARESVRYGNRLRNISSITAAGDTLFVTLYASATGLPALLDIPVSRDGEAAPLGTGPYRFSREEDGAWLRANPNWWQGNGQPVEGVYLEESQDAMLYRFTSGDVQLIVSSLISTNPAAITGNIRYRDVPTTRLHFLSCNVSRYPMNSAAFRRALSLGINRAGIASSLLSGHALPAQFPVSPVSPLYPADMEETYTAAAMPSALAEMGWQAERALILLVNSDNSFKVSAARSIAESFTKAGVPTEVRALSWEAYQEAVPAGDWDLCYGEASLPADWNLSPLLAAGGSLNLGNWSDWTGSRLASAFTAAGDRTAAMREVCTYLRDNAPFLTLCFGNSSVLTQAEVVEGLNPTAAEPFYNLAECRIHLRED